MENILFFATVLVPIITALVQVVKSTVALPKTLLPLIALIIGLAIGFLASPFTDLTFDLRLWAGGIAGLASVGFFELGNKRTGTTKE